MRTHLPKLLLTILAATIIFVVDGFAQLNFVVNSLADDQYAYAYDDPNTPEDESIDGVCKDELGRCTIRAAFDEAWNMNQWVDIIFSVSGTINLIDVLYLPDNSMINGNNNINLINGGGIGCLQIENDCTIKGLTLGSTFYGLTINGQNNQIGDIDLPVEFLNCQVGIVVEGDSNYIFNSYVGITTLGTLAPNQMGILVIGTGNKIGADIGYRNVICGNVVAGIMLADSGGNWVQGSYIGTNGEGDLGLGNATGILISSPNNFIGSDYYFAGNTISGNANGILISGAPPDDLAENNSIERNVIGLSRNESKAIPNNTGISITNAAIQTFIYDNTIAGNTNVGIGVFGYDSESYTQGVYISKNKIGINGDGNIYPNGNAGISILGNVDGVSIGFDQSFVNTDPNIIVGNSNYGIEIRSQFGYSPENILFRKNIIYQNSVNNCFLDPSSNSGFASPYSLSYSNSTLAGIHNLPNVVIDVYKDIRSELTPSSYAWLGSTTTNSSGVFTFEITDPSVESVSVTASQFNFISGKTSAFTILDLLTDIEDEKQIPTEFSLAQNYPNPFNPNTKIRFSIPNVETGLALTVLKVYDVLGNEVATLVDEYKAAGNYEVDFNAEQLSTGIYFYKLTVGDFTSVKKMTFIK